MPRAFVIRGFGKHKDSSGTEMDFDLVDSALITPAIARCNLVGGTTSMPLRVWASIPLQSALWRQIETGAILQRQLIGRPLLVGEVSPHEATILISDR